MALVYYQCVKVEMYSQGNASGEHQWDVHFCRTRCRTGRNCRRCKPFSLNASKASLLVMTNWLMGRWICWWAFGHLSRRLVAWPGFGGCLQPRAPTPHTTTQPPNPPPRDPSVEQSPPSDSHPNCRAPALAEETKEKKKFGWPDTWSRISSFNMNEMAEWGIFLQTFGTFLGFSIPFLNPFHPCTIGTTTLDLKFISGRHHQHAKGLKEEDFRFSFWILKETKKAFYPPTFSMSKFPKKKMTPLTEEELNAVTSQIILILLQI